MMANMCNLDTNLGFTLCISYNDRCRYSLENRVDAIAIISYDG